MWHQAEGRDFRTRDRGAHPRPRREPAARLFASRCGAHSPTLEVGCLPDDTILLTLDRRMVCTEPSGPVSLECIARNRPGLGSVTTFDYRCREAAQDGGRE